MLSRSISTKLILLIVLLPFIGLAQQQNNVWTTSDSIMIDFNSGVPVVSSSVHTGNSTATVSDPNTGQLLFYTDGSQVWDNRHRMMPNGTNLTGLDQSNAYIGTVSATGHGMQTSLIVPMPDSANKFYIFSLTSIYTLAEQDKGKLFYSIVDMNLNNGYGDIVAGRKGIPMDSMLSLKMIAVTGDDCNIWLLVHARTEPIFKAYEINTAGLGSQPVISNSGFLTYEYTDGLVKASPDRRMLVTTNPVHALLVPATAQPVMEIYDFNPVSGVVSNARKLNGQGNYYGACFSPDNSKLYAGNMGYISQYDVSVPSPQAIIASRVNLYLPPFGPPWQRTRYPIPGDLKLAPDGKIYFLTQLSSTISVINLPDVADTFCQMVPYYLALPTTLKWYAITLPNEVPAFLKAEQRAHPTSIINVCAVCHVQKMRGKFRTKHGAATRSPQLPLMIPH